MRIEVRLFATLREHLPPGSSRTAAQMDVPTGASIRNVLVALGVPAQKAAIILVDGHYEANRERALAEDAVLSIWPHVAGG